MPWWIARATPWPAFLIRAATAATSAAFGVHGAEAAALSESSYRTLSHPAVTLWNNDSAGEICGRRAANSWIESALFRLIRPDARKGVSHRAESYAARRGATRIDAQHLQAQRVLFKTTPPPGRGHADPQADNQPPPNRSTRLREWLAVENIPIIDCVPT